MRTVFALLVGIDDYTRIGRASLGGCLNDVAAARSWLEKQVEPSPVIRTLLDADATVEAVAEGIRTHLGQAGPEDTALFWFSGHGTEFPALPEELAVESTGRSQALVCADGPLPDKRLRVLLDRIAARGTHVAAVLDCCYAGGATRDAVGTVRFLPPDPSWPAAAAARDAEGTPTDPGHVLLAASRLDQLSYEDWFDGRQHGVFTHALLGALGEAGGRESTYRRLLAAVHCRVQRSGDRQRPVLLPLQAGGPADRPFLGGAVREPSRHLLRHGPLGWEVDCGTVHGLHGGEDGARGTEFTVTAEPTVPPTGQDAPGTGGDVPGTGGAVLRARSVGAERTLVEPSGWAPDPRRSYPVALSALALPPVSVLVEAPGAPGAARELAEALGSAGPGGGPSPLLRTAAGLEDASGLCLRVVVHGGRARILLRDGTSAVPPLPLAGPADARRVADCLVHLASWHQLRDLTSPDPVLSSLVRVEVTPWDGDDPILPDGSGELLCAYGGGPGDWRVPRVSIRIRNRSAGRTLWCVLLDLTDSHASHSALFPGHFIGPGGVGHALDGEPVYLNLPAGRPVRPGSYTRDWLKLIVAEGELNTVPFQLDPWDPTAPVDRKTQRHPDGVFRPTGPDRGRDLGPGPRPASPGRWATLTLPIRTVVPDHRNAGS
ncbi:caspase family protein [Kitasatospora sp. HPMI-4]|uniref:caspase family protein n=1 Tax=Kitasatospora sp. HPMI-4 TaxID=3448443 RepID=UPI003F1B6846